MANAILIFSDSPDGAVELKAAFEGGYSEMSPAHRQASIFLAEIDVNAADRITAGEEPATVIAPADVFAG